MKQHIFLLVFLLMLTGCKQGKELIPEDSYEFDTEFTEDEKESITTIYAEIDGAVLNPGVYELEEGSRVFNLIDMAGGFAENADSRSVKQAERVLDGETIYVYNVDEYEEMLLLGIGDNYHGNSSNSGLINLNTASKEELMTLTGIGESRALSIISYREQYGGFASTEDIMKVAGIGQGTYEKIKDSITV